MIPDYKDYQGEHTASDDDGLNREGITPTYVVDEKSYGGEEERKDNREGVSGTVT